MVTWVTLASTDYSIVQYNKAGFPLTLQASGGVTKFTDGGSEHRVLYIHRVKLTGLAPDQMYGRCTLTTVYILTVSGSMKIISDFFASAEIACIE